MIYQFKPDQFLTPINRHALEQNQVIDHEVLFLMQLCMHRRVIHFFVYITALIANTQALFLYSISQEWFTALELSHGMANLAKGNSRIVDALCQTSYVPIYQSQAWQELQATLINTSKEIRCTL